MKKSRVTSVLSFRATKELIEQIKAYATLKKKRTLAEAIIELIKIGLENVIK